MMTNVEIVQRLKAIFDLPVPILLKDKDPSKRPSPLYHFTDCGGLVGILTGRTLWASLAAALNDPSEMQYAIERARFLLKSGSIDADPRFRFATLKALDPSDESRAIQIEWRVYVVSFCANAHSALHWLHYGRSGTGVAVGFDATRIDAPGFELLPVIYEQTEQDVRLRALLEGAWQRTAEALESVPTDDHNAVILGAGELAANNLWLAAPMMKDPAFQAENEWRLFTFEPKGLEFPPGIATPTETHFRSVSGRVVPYKKVQYSPPPITDLILGAAAPMEPGDMGIRILAEETLGTSISVTRSSVPVRP
jgi:hypothetical protein